VTAAPIYAEARVIGLSALGFVELQRSPYPRRAMSAAPDNTDSALRLADEIYSPFNSSDTRRLRAYVQRMEHLVSSTFFQPGMNTLTLSAEAGGPLKSTLDYPGEEAVRAVVGLFRQLYNHHEQTSYNSILKLMGITWTSAVLLTATRPSPSYVHFAHGRRKHFARRCSSSGSTLDPTARSKRRSSRRLCSSTYFLTAATCTKAMRNRTSSTRGRWRTLRSRASSAR
jgi:hypothetical protein